jgi:hypothetical protein
MLTDVDRCAAVLEWTRFNQEIRCYTATPIHPDMARQELQDFDYAGRGYPTA